MAERAQRGNVPAAQRLPLMLPESSGFEPFEGSGLRKAAILMVALGDELAKTLFQSLSESDVHRVTEEITRLGEIKAQQLTQVLTNSMGCSKRSSTWFVAVRSMRSACLPRLSDLQRQKLCWRK